MKTRRGLSLFELIIGIAIMMIALSTATISVRSLVHSPKREAGKIEMYLVNLMKKSDRIKMSFEVTVNTSNPPGKSITAKWENQNDSEPPLRLDEVCTYEGFNDKQNTNQPLNYSYKTYPRGAKIFAAEKLPDKDSQGHPIESTYIKITATDAQDYYVVITDQDRQ